MEGLFSPPMSDYKLNFLPSSDYINRLLDKRGAPLPSVVMQPTSNSPVGTVISGATDKVFSVMMTQSGEKRSLNFYLHSENGNALTQSIKLGRHEKVDRIDLYQLDVNKDGEPNLIAVAVDEKNHFISGAIVYSAEKSLPSD